MNRRSNEWWSGVNRSVNRRIAGSAAVLAAIACVRVAPEPQADARATLGVRNAHALVYDGVRGEVILFGGADETQVRADTWTWNGISWRRVAVGGPAPRTFPAAAYDGANKAAFIFGGNRVLFGTDSSRDTFLSDLWKWDGRHWTLQSGSGPGPRAEAAMTYDQRRRRLVLFGGYRKVDGQSTRLGDTWEWDGKAWTLMTDSGPTPRNGAAMVYDPVRGVAVLFGGSDGTASGETWEWDGTRWTRGVAPMTEPRYNTVMWYDVVSRRLLRFGGWYNMRRWGDTWAYDGAHWERLGAAGPSPRNHTAVAYDYRRQRAVLVGGHDGDRVFGDVWEWLGDRWVEASHVLPEVRVDNGH